MRAPDGTERDVPDSLVAHYTDLGATVVDGGGGMAELALGTLPVLGGIGGGAIGLASMPATGPVGPIAGAGLGSAGGEALRRLLAQGLGVEESQSPGDNALGVATAGALGSFGGAGVAGGKMLAPALRRAASSPQAQGVGKAALRLGGRKVFGGWMDAAEFGRDVFRALRPGSAPAPAGSPWAIPGRVPPAPAPKLPTKLPNPSPGVPGPIPPRGASPAAAKAAKPPRVRRAVAVKPTGEAKAVDMVEPPAKVPDVGPAKLAPGQRRIGPTKLRERQAMFDKDKARKAAAAELRAVPRQPAPPEDDLARRLGLSAKLEKEMAARGITDPSLKLQLRREIRSRVSELGEGGVRTLTLSPSLTMLLREKPKE